MNWQIVWWPPFTKRVVSARAAPVFRASAPGLMQELTRGPRGFKMVSMSDDQAPDPAESAVTFLGFILSLAHTAAVHFGDVPDPVSGQTIPANLPAAQQMIDILALLEEKTRGNLTAEERQFLDQILYELRLRYVEATKQGTPPEPSRIIIP
jgi:hypothetical protein